MRWHGNVLLFLTADVPFEESLSIYLLDADLNVIDSAQMYHMYGTGVFSDLDITQPDTARFRFFGGIIWTLKLFSGPTFALPFVSDPPSVHRPFGFMRTFRIYGNPLPETS